MQQSNALRRLKTILDEAVTNGDRQELSGPILLRAMRLGEQPQNVVDFYELLDKAEEEAKELKNTPKITRYLQIILEDILGAIRKYHMDGTKGLEDAAQSLVSDLVMKEFSFKAEDQKNPTYRHIRAFVLSLLIYITPSGRI